MKIYTKAGDGGMTSILGKDKVSKSHIRIEAYGTIDELNAFLGVSVNFSSQSTKHLLLVIQNKLFDVGTELASETIKPRIKEDDVKFLEDKIDEISEQIPELKNFILPGGSIASSWLHVARTVTRRAERKIVELSKTAPLNPTTIKFVNRLSDLFFVLARFENVKMGVADTIWENKQFSSSS